MISSSSEDDNAAIMDIVTKQSVLTNKAPQMRKSFQGMGGMYGQQSRSSRPMPGNMSATHAPPSMMGSGAQNKMRAFNTFGKTGKNAPANFQGDSKRPAASMLKGGPSAGGGAGLLHGQKLAGSSISIAKGSKMKAINMHAIRRSGQAEAKKQSKKIQLMDKKLKDRFRKSFQTPLSKSKSKGHGMKMGQKSRGGKQMVDDDDDTVNEDDDGDEEDDEFRPTPLKKKGTGMGSGKSRGGANGSGAAAGAGG